MRHRILTLILALAAGAGMLCAAPVRIDGLRYRLDAENKTAEVTAQGTGAVNVKDRSLADWEALPAEYVAEAVCPADAALTGLKSVRVFADAQYINILVEPDLSQIIDLLWVPFHVFIDTDNSDATGGFGDFFLDANADVVLEGAVFATFDESRQSTPEESAYSYNPAVFKWWGEVGGNGWQWVDPAVMHDDTDYWGAIVGEGQAPVGASQYVDGKIEIQLLREFIPATWNESEFGIGVDIQQNWSSVGILPCASATDENPAGRASKMKVRICRETADETTLSGKVTVPGTVEYEGVPYTVTGIGDYAFALCKDVTAVSLPASVTGVGKDAFAEGMGIYVPCGELDRFRAMMPAYGNQVRYEPLPYNVTVRSSEGGEVRTNLSELSLCDEKPTATFTAVPYTPYYRFELWSDGNTDNPRQIEITQDMTIEAVFSFALTGTCGKDNALTWTLNPTDSSLVIFGKGELTANYAYLRVMKSVTVGNEISIIGEEAFADSYYLQHVLIGSSVRVIENGAFIYCPSIADITCYGQRPPTVKEQTFDTELPYSTIIYVPTDYLNTYKMHDIWGVYDVRPLGASSAEVTEVAVTPAENTVTIAWPPVDGVTVYELVIRDKEGNIVCTLVFNANGQLTQIVFAAPARDHAPQHPQSSGFAFTVTGLEEGTSYDLTITAKDGEGNTLDEKQMSFTTQRKDYQATVSPQTNGPAPVKALRDGQVVILRGDKTYTLTGTELR